jgi:valyl-tRNA synthetase
MLLLIFYWKAGKVSEGRAFKNVICLGHIVDAKGKKMSKSKGNIVDPMHIMNEYSADMLRYFLYTVNQPGMTKKFDVKSIKDVMNRGFPYALEFVLLFRDVCEY